MTKDNVSKLPENVIPAIMATGKHVFLRQELASILRAHRKEWKLDQSITLTRFIDLLRKLPDFKVVKIDLSYRKETRYTIGNFSVYELATSLRPNSYLTHFTAMHLHGLTEQIPMTVYLNFEQSPKRKQRSELTQELMDRAFRRDIKRGKSRIAYGDYTIHIINGMHTGRLGVIKLPRSDDEIVSTTNIERTLIDITVRPEFSGGPYEVLKAYKLAADRVSVNALAALLKKLDYVYPYHQAIGFYLQRAGVYKDSRIELLRGFETRYDFYLTHNMKDMDYISEWRLFIPKGF